MEITTEHKKRFWPALGVLILAVVGILVLVSQQDRLFQTGQLEDSTAVLELLDTQFPDSTIHEDILDPGKIVVVHNGDSEQCKRALDFLDHITQEYPYDVVIYNVEEENYLAPLAELPEDECWVDTDVVNQWFVYPTIFVEDQVFVGYSNKTRRAIESLLVE